MSRYPRKNAAAVPPNQRLAYRVTEVETMCGFGRGKVDRLVAQGKLTKIKLDGVVLITADSVNKLLETAA